MPSQLRNRQLLINGKSKGASNGQSCELASQDSADLVPIMKKKMLLLEEDCSENNNNNVYSESMDADEDTFADTCTMDIHTKINDENPMIFSQLKTSINQTVKDQFAAALLRLQTDLDAASQRMTEVETKVDNLHKLQRNRNALQAKESNRAGLFNRDNLVTLAYLSWPIVVIVAMKAIERRSVASK